MSELSLLSGDSIGPDEAPLRINRGHQSLRNDPHTTRIGAARGWQLTPRCTPGRQLPYFPRGTRQEHEWKLTLKTG
jgi:hypothetical protein